jgi:hypothetical protein
VIDIALDPLTGDLLIIDVGATLVYGIDQIAQNLAIRLRFIQGEWFLNILAGIPYYQYFFIKAPNQIQVESFLKEAIMNTRGVLQILDFSSLYNPSNRSYSVNFECQTIDGNIQLEQDLP